MKQSLIRLTSLLVLVAMIATMLTACAPAAAPAPAATTAPAAAPTTAPAAEPTQAPAAPAGPDVLTPSKAAKVDWQQCKGTTLNALVVKHWWTDAITPMLPQFQELTGMTVKFDVLSEDTYFQKALTELSSGSGAYDMLMVGNQQVGQYMNGGWLEDLNPYFNNPKLTDMAWYDMEDLLPSGRAAGQLDGKQFALPVGSEAGMLFYRKDIFEEKGLKPPTTFDELYETAKSLKTNDMAGYVTRGKRGLDVIWQWTTFLLSYGGRYFDEQGQPAFNSPEGIAATEMFVKLLVDAGPEGTMNWSWMEASQNFAQGKSAMYVDAGGLGPGIDKEGNPAYGKVGYVTMPAAGEKPVIPNYWFWMFGMPAGGKQKECAFLFTEWATSKTLGIPLSMGGSSPARATVWNSKEITSWAEPNWAKASLGALQQVQPKLVPYDRADYPEIVDAISAEINNIQAGTKTAKQGLDDAAAKVADIIK